MRVIDQYGVTHYRDEKYLELRCGRNELLNHRILGNQLERITCQYCEPSVCRSANGIVHRLNQVTIAVPFVALVTAYCDILRPGLDYDSDTTVTCFRCLTNHEDLKTFSVKAYAEATGCTYGVAWEKLEISRHIATSSAQL